MADDVPDVRDRARDFGEVPDDFADWEMDVVDEESMAEITIPCYKRTSFRCCGRWCVSHVVYSVNFYIPMR